MIKKELPVERSVARRLTGDKKLVNQKNKHKKEAAVAASFLCCPGPLF